ncbi:MAG: hypothetical protein PVH68_05000 [Armatimonadota bacterium]|jgi:hypothetical protein
MTRQRRLLSALLVLAFAAGWAGLASIAETAEDAVEQRVRQVIEQNLSAWRFKPGREVFVNKSVEPAHGVDLDVAPDGRLYLAWSERRSDGAVIKVATSPDGQEWQTEAEFARTESYIPSLAIAANYGAPYQDPRLEKAAAAWIEKAGCFASLRSAGGEWGDPQPVWEISPAQGSVDMVSDAEGSFHLLALARFGKLGGRPLLSRWRHNSGWGRPFEVEGKIARRAHLGYRPEASFGVITLGEDNSLVGGRHYRWDTIARLPWEAWDTVSLWVWPKGSAAALRRRPVPLSQAVSLATSEDLREWSDPIFLGWCNDGRRNDAVAVARGQVYAATTYEHWWLRRGVAQDQRGEKVEWKSPRVFLLDDGLTRDTDGDGLTDITEECFLTDPGQPDTDGDGVRDKEDPDPLASSVPEGDEAQIREAVFRAVVPGAADLVHADTMIVSAPERQAFPEHDIRVLCLTPQETAAYRAKCGVWALPVLEVPDIKTRARSAVAEWQLVVAGLAGAGGHAKLEKRDGEWIVTDKGQEWVS